MARRLNTYVHVDGVAYGPESDVPDEVAEKITAPGVWADPDPADATPEDAADQGAAAKPARRSAKASG